MVSEIFNQLGEDVGGLIGAVKLCILSIDVFEGASLKDIFLAVFVLLNFSQLEVDFVTKLAAFAR